MQTRRQHRHFMPINRVFREEQFRLVCDLAWGEASSVLGFGFGPGAEELAVGAPGAEFVVLACGDFWGQ